MRGPNKGTILALLTLVVPLALAPHGEPGVDGCLSDSAESQAPLQHDVSVALKLIQVYVTDDSGNPVAGLGKSDFELFVDGARVEITEFENHVSTPGTPKGSVTDKAPSSDHPNSLPTPSEPLMPRKFILLFDFAYNNPRGIIQAKAAAKHFLGTELGPEDEVGVISVSMARGLAVHEFLTTRHDLVSKVVEAVNVKDAAGRADEIEEEFWRRQSEGTLNTGGKSLFQLNSERQDSRAQVSQFLEIMTELATALRYVSGQKHILFFSTGLPESLVYGNRMSQYMVREPGGRVRTVYDPGDASLIRKNETMLKEFAAANCSFFTFDTREAALVQSLFTYDSQTFEDGQRSIFTERGVAQNTNQVFKDDKLTGLFALRKTASATGGEFFSDIKEYERSMARVQAMTNSYYILGYRLNERLDGRFHKIRINVKTKGYTVRTQAGYFNPKSFSKYSELEKQLDLFDLALNERAYSRIPVDFPMTALSSTLGGSSRLAILANIPADVITRFSGRRIELVTIFFDSKGEVSEVVREEADSASIRDRGISFGAGAVLNPGDYSCRLVVRDMDTGQSAVASTKATIGKPQITGIQLGTPLVLEARTGYTFLSASSKKAREAFPWADIYPYDSANLSPVLAELPANTASVQVVIPCVVAGGGQPELALSANLVSAASGERSPISITRMMRSQKVPSEILTLELPTAGIAPGTYYLHFYAQDRAAGSLGHTFTTLVIPDR
jgi:VWFA-related protein